MKALRREPGGLSFYRSAEKRSARKLGAKQRQKPKAHAVGLGFACAAAKATERPYPPSFSSKRASFKALRMATLRTGAQITARAPFTSVAGSFPTISAQH